MNETDGGRDNGVQRKWRVPGSIYFAVLDVPYGYHLQEGGTLAGENVEGHTHMTLSWVDAGRKQWLYVIRLREQLHYLENSWGEASCIYHFPPYP